MENSELITKTLWYIRNQKSNTALTIDDIAEHAGFSTDYFNRIFLAHTGFNVMEYLRFCRLKNAAMVLRNSDVNVLDVALQSGYETHESFSRAFKKQFAQTPALYRRAEDWNAFGICPPIRLGAFTLPQPEFLSLPDKHLVGLTQSYSCTLEQITTVRGVGYRLE